MSNSDAQPGNTRGLDVVKWLLAFALLTLAVVGNAYYADQPLLYRAIAGVFLIVAAGVVAMLTDRGREFNAFRKEAAVELRKIVWPTRPETIQTTLIVFVVVFVMSIVLYLLDLGIGYTVSRIIG